MGDSQPYVTIRSRRPADGLSMSSGDSTYGSSIGDDKTPSATHDISRVNYHVKHLSDFAKTLEDSAARAFPNRGRSQRYKKVQALLLHWKCDDLFVLPELEDLEQCLREDYSFETDTFPIPSDNPHLDLMMRVGQMVKEHESSDTLFLIYYGGHARIDESRQSTWCATRSSDSPWLQWSAIQTLLERSLSDVLILLDCCAGAASATFPNGNSITETISASSWDAIAPDPGRYSFTNALIEVLQEWKKRTYSAAMLHAEILARLKHPRPIMLNGKHFEARSTPVHFMMTTNHRAPSIEMSRILSDDNRPPSPTTEPETEAPVASGRSGIPQDIVDSEPNEDVPHVMISLALEDDQRLDVDAWESWLAAFPAIAKYVKVQGVFKSHSTLMLLSLPIMVWDLLPEDLACNFVAFVRSNNLAIRSARVSRPGTVEVPTGSKQEKRSSLSGSTALSDFESQRVSVASHDQAQPSVNAATSRQSTVTPFYGIPPSMPPFTSNPDTSPSDRWVGSNIGPPTRQHTAPASVLTRTKSNGVASSQMVVNQTRNSTRKLFKSSDNLQSRPNLAPRIQTRLEDYFEKDPAPTIAVTEFLASNLGIETTDIDLWFHHRREQQEVAEKLQSLGVDNHTQELPREGVHMILPGHLNKLLDIISSDQMLLVDLRSATDYERSHIHDAIHFQAPASFVQRAPLEMIEKALADDASRDVFNKWYTSECVVFYDGNIQFAWECPTAEALFQKFRGKGWFGQGFVLKGHYREFSDSFDRYIGGQKMSNGAKKYLESLQGKSREKQKQNHQEYNDWLKLLESEDRVLPTEIAPARRTSLSEAVLRHQKDLEDEFERRLPSLYRKAMDLRPDGNWDIKAPLVEHLARGLGKMQEAGRAGGDSKPGYSDYPEKARDQHLAEGSHLVDSDDEQPANDGALQKGDTKTPEDGGGSGGDPKKGRGRNLLKMLRSGR
ncbi:homeobox domain-containing protein [Xylariales sp. AK1849]|nr:homeobox domain-containing protein [Xylariales sp. AK1849]